MRLGLLFLLARLAASHGKSNKALTPDDFLQGFNLTEIHHHLNEFLEIARANGNNRAAGTSGHKASVNYIDRTISSRCGSKVNVTVQKFHLDRYGGSIRSLRGPDGELVDVRGVKDERPTRSIESAPLIEMTSSPDENSGCDDDRWKNLEASGKVVLVRGIRCPISSMVETAVKRQNGTLGILLYDYPEETRKSFDEYIQGTVPVALIKDKVGRSWSKRLAADEQLTVDMTVHELPKEVWGHNMIAETVTGDENNIIMLGANLDSHPMSPGINDNGSGSAALLAMLTRLCEMGPTRNRVRFAWWDGSHPYQRRGLRGSLHYIEELSWEGSKNIRLYFNHHRIGSLFPLWSVYSNSGDDASIGADVLVDALQGTDGFHTLDDGVELKSSKEVTADHIPFQSFGIPTSGIVTGDEEPCDYMAGDESSMFPFRQTTRTILPKQSTHQAVYKRLRTLDIRHIAFARLKLYGFASRTGTTC
ncbi:hypothetical protein GQ602_000759 [Ophiocordyceps camponoti-floridani]|uniref:Peptide hydrolase n=1 Tax=Ophiocordyceps camponoti-floridani TaxID=2030778 RepID=A0A8H4QCS9_9HYPO|nr:hypothetical protein GQ602_000759 [Ophiocordyceps camponoti-floridani]